MTMTEPKPKRPKKKAEGIIELPKPREFEAKACSACAGIRPIGKSYSRVYCTRGRVRYCRCDFCGNTWSQQA